MRTFSAARPVRPQRQRPPAPGALAGGARAGIVTRVPRFRFWGAISADPKVMVGDPRFEDWETVSTFEDQDTALAWRDQLRMLGVDAACVADHALDRHGRGDIYVVVPPGQWERANEIVENLD